MSVSYAWPENDQCNLQLSGECEALGIDSQQYVQRVNTQFQKIGLRGVTLVVGSGDFGANGNPNACGTMFEPDFPASSPFVLTVGGTELVDTVALANPPPICAAAGMECVVSGSQQACSGEISQFSAGGGFSAVAPMPAYQRSAVQSYLSSNVTLPPPPYYNASGRAFPDVSAFAHNLLTVFEGAAQPVGGTSAATPIIAAIIGRLNAYSLQLSGKTLGFVNVFLYQAAALNPATFRDITVGRNNCGWNGCCPEAFEAAPGWDAVTGLGVVDVAQLASTLKRMHAARKRKAP